MIKVVHYTRKPRPLGNFSVEIYFGIIRKQLSGRVHFELAQSRFFSNGLLRRLFNCVEAIFRQGDVNHILGDVTFLATFLNRKKTITTFLDCNVLLTSSGLGHYIIRLFWFTIPVKKSKYITVISESTKSELIAYTGCRSDKIRVIYVAVSDSFKPQFKEFNSAEPVILQLGTAPNKNIPRLVEAISGINCKLVIVGKTDEHIKALLKQHAVNYLLYEKHLSEEEIISLYCQSDIVSFVSTYEGFGMPIIEANAIGRVVITGNTTSMPEVASDAACIVDPMSVESIRGGMNRIISDAAYRQKLISNGFINSKRFDKEKIANQFYNLYHDTFSGK
jgi:glycosyltransferase involved in cell wall biosynthesis